MLMVLCAVKSVSAVLKMKNVWKIGQNNQTRDNFETVFV